MLVVIGDTDLCHISRVDPPDCNISNFQWIRVTQILIVYGLDSQCVLSCYEICQEVVSIFIGIDAFSIIPEHLAFSCPGAIQSNDQSHQFLSAGVGVHSCLLPRQDVASSDVKVDVVEGSLQGPPLACGGVARSRAIVIPMGCGEIGSDLKRVRLQHRAD